MPLQFIPSIHRLTHRIGLSIAGAQALAVSQGEAHVLAHLASEGDSTIAGLQRGFAHRPSTLTSILDRLEKRGALTREMSTQDRRSFVIRLSRSGKVLGRKVLMHLEAVEECFAASLTEGERKELTTLLQKVEASFPAL